MPEILEAVLAPALADCERRLDLANPQGSYEPRDCCIQYRESDFDFCSRLMEEEGIAYGFDPDAMEASPAEVLQWFDTHP